MFIVNNKDTRTTPLTNNEVRSENFHFQGEGVPLMWGEQKIFIFKGGCPIRMGGGGVIF